MKRVLMAAAVVLLAACGPSYEGEHRDGKRHGQGIATSPDGTRIEGEWRGGVFNPKFPGIWGVELRVIV